jgi:hypothetical protein
MNTIELKSTNGTPVVHFGEDGNLVIKGRSIAENVKDFYQTLIDWGGKLHIKKLTVEVDIDYMNSTSSKNLLYFFKVLDNNKHIDKMIVHWYYEIGDEDTLSKGHIFSEFMHKAKFRYHLHTDGL